MSYAIGLLFLTRKYADEAESLIRVFLMKTEQEYTDIVFSPNLRSLNHLAWQVRKFGPLWTCSFMMFESANYLLQSKFTGTVNILPPIIERYHRKKDTLKQKVGDNYLADLCHRMRNNSKCFKRSKLHVSKLPSDYRSDLTPCYKNAKLAYFELDSVSHSCASNSYVTFVANGALHCGQKQFFNAGSPERMMIQFFEIRESYLCEKKTDIPVFSFHIVKQSSRVALVNLHCVIEKLLRIDPFDKIYLIPLINMFEHD